MNIRIKEKGKISFQNVIEAAKLVSLPEIYIKLKELMDSPDYSMADVAVLVSGDPGMATRFLRAVNNPFNRRTVEIESVAHAVSLLGTSQVSDIVLSVSVAQALEGFKTGIISMKKFWEQSYYCAVLAKLVALKCEAPDSERLYTMGLLHDIGHLFMYQAIPEKAQQAILDSKDQAQPLSMVEWDSIGFDYAIVGSFMMKQWKLPGSFQVATCFHTQPDKTDQFQLETRVLNIASTLVRADLAGGEFGEGPFTVNPEILAETGLTKDQCLALLETARETLAETKDYLFI